MDISVAPIAITLAAVVLLCLVIYIYNRLVAMRNKVRDAWSGVDVELTFRHDLVPNLVEAVKGYVDHEHELLKTVAQTRSAAMRAGTDVATRAMAEMMLGSAVGNLFAVAEHNPQLRASQNFLLLQEQLTTTENRIAFARQHYNEIVRQFNTFIAEFPWNLLAERLGYAPEKMFAAESQDRAAVQIAT